MTGPQDPVPPEVWGFPDVDPATPTSVQLPAAEPVEPSYDTGSDAWWRAQAEVQRVAAAPIADPVTPAPAPEEPTGLRSAPVPSPLDRDWVPPQVAAAAGSPAPGLEQRPERQEADPPLLAPNAEGGTAGPLSRPPLARQLVGDLPPPILPAPPANPPDQQQAAGGRGRALAGAALAVAGVVLGVGALLLFRHGDQGSPVVATPPAGAISTPAVPSAAVSTPAVPASPQSGSEPIPGNAPPTAAIVPPASASPVAPIVPVSVLNNSRIRGLADRGATRYRQAGWPVARTGNYSGGTIATTSVYYPSGGQASAERFARQFGINRIVPRFPGLPTTGMTVILTRDYR